MERINTFDGTVFRRTEIDKKELKKKKKVKKSFSSLISEKEAASAEEALEILQNEDIPLETLLDNIHEIGEELKENPTLQMIKKYKIAVNGFMKFVVQNSFTVEEKISGVNILKRKRFTLVNIINEKLEKLAAEILRNQKDQLEILRRVDEIKGLLIDLVS